MTIGINKLRESSQQEDLEAETGERFLVLEVNMQVKLEEDLDGNMIQIQDLLVDKYNVKI